MTHPNIYPVPGPAAANLPPAPGAETVPEPNQLMPETQWASDRREVSELLTELDTTHRQEANLRKFTDQGKIHQRDVSGHEQNIRNARAGIYQRMDALARRSDTSRILDVLDESADVAQSTYQKANDRVSAPDGTVAAAEGARFRSDATLVAQRDLSRGHSLNPIRIRRTDPPEVQAEQKRQLRLRVREQKLHDHAYGRDEYAALGAETTRSRSLNSRNKIEGFDGSVASLANSLRNSHDALRANIEDITTNVTDELGTWDIRQPASPGQEQYVRGRLEDLTLMIGTLSPYDQLRAQAQGEYTRLRHRVEARGILADTATGQPNPDRQYRPDGGILLYPNTSDEVVIYGNGISARREGANGEFVYRRPSGHEAPSPLDPTEISIGAVSLRDPNAALTQWEANRTPETAQVAHAALSEVINRETAREAHVAAYMQQVGGEIAANQTRIAQANTFLNDLRTALGTQGRAPNAEEQQQINQAQQTVAQSQAAIPQLRANHARAEADLAATRQSLNPNRYWQARLEVGANRQVNPAAVQARFMVGRAVQRAQDALPAAPVLARDGSLILDNATINGRHADQWRIWPDGRTSTFDQRSGRTYFFNPDGTP
jgi:hypothetical protein